MTWLRGGISLFVFFAACGSHAPKTTWCVFRAEDQTFYCTDKDDKDFIVEPKEADKFVAQPMRDAEAIRNYVIDLEKQAAKCQ